MRVHLGFGGSPLFRTFPEDIVNLVLLLDVDVAQVLDDHGSFLVGIVVQPAISFRYHVNDLNILNILRMLR